jgi:hypothetical protein
VKIIPDHTKSAEDLFVGIVDNYISIDWDDAVPIIWLLADMLDSKNMKLWTLPLTLWMLPLNCGCYLCDVCEISVATCVEQNKADKCERKITVDLFW